MDMVFIHVLLLLEQAEDRHQQWGVFLIRGIPSAEEALQVPDVPAHVGKLFLYRLTNLFLRVLPALYECQAVFPCIR